MEQECRRLACNFAPLNEIIDIPDVRSNNIEKCGNPFWTFTCATRLAADEYKHDSTSLQTHPSPQEATIRFEWAGISGIISTINSKNGGPHENGRI